MADRLNRMFSLRTDFMRAIKEKYPQSYPDWPVDVSKKRAQRALRETALKGVEEMFEALQHLKNWKPHKKHGESNFDRAEFLEEMVDAFNYFFAMLVMLGVDEDEFMNAFEAKNKKIHERLSGKY